MKLLPKYKAFFPYTIVHHFRLEVEVIPNMQFGPMSQNPNQYLSLPKIYVCLVLGSKFGELVLEGINEHKILHIVLIDLQKKCFAIYNAKIVFL